MKPTTQAWVGLALSLCLLITACGEDTLGPNLAVNPTPTIASTPIPTPTPRTTCPDQYVEIQGLSPYSATKFCVAKYEMKQVTSLPQSQASGLPWVSITRDAAITACQSLGTGYDLIANSEWNTVAREIQSTAANWNTGAVGGGSVNRGHSDGTPAQLLDASSDDVAGNCYLTGQSCSATVWSDQRRTFVLPDGSIIWDFAGNAWEFIKDTYAVSPGANAWVATLSAGGQQDDFGANATQLCSTPGSTPYCNFGYARTATAGGAFRGGDVTSGTFAGIFASYSGAIGASTTAATVGFRCVYHYQ